MQRLDMSSEEARDTARAWWVILALGIASLVAGIILVLRPSHSLATLAVIFGIFLLLDGILALVRSFGPGENRALAAIVGVLGIVIGIALIRHPVHGVSAIGLLIGIWLVAAGVIRLVTAIAERRRLLLQIIIALLEVVVGIVIVSDPHIGYTALAIIVGIWLIINGFGMITLAIALRAVTRER
jgi:uncharacterized membrane protein HdeD (DUF308 family)